jgi:hypothetical protein
MQTNKGRFKCADEAQAVWNYISLGDDISFGELFSGDYERGDKFIEYTANCLHSARLIHGSIYDEYGRIEDKDVAHSFLIDFDACECCKLEEHVQDMIKNGKIRGTIFY